MAEKVISFTQLEVWKQSHTLVIDIYKSCENIRYNHVVRNQIERSALSISSNISEGFGRDSIKDKTHFYIMARGSLYELQNQLLVMRDLSLIDQITFKKIADKSSDVQRLLHGLIRSTRKKASS